MVFTIITANINGIGPNSVEKIYKAKNELESNNANLLMLTETKTVDFQDHIFTIFPASKYSYLFTKSSMHLDGNMGALTIIKK